MFSRLMSHGFPKNRLTGHLGFKGPWRLKVSRAEKEKSSRPRWRRPEVGSPARQGRRPGSGFRHPLLSPGSKRSGFAKANSNSAKSSLAISLTFAKFAKFASLLGLFLFNL